MHRTPQFGYRGLRISFQPGQHSVGIANALTRFASQDTASNGTSSSPNDYRFTGGY